jgi:hypothetical protein
MIVKFYLEVTLVVFRNPYFCVCLLLQGKKRLEEVFQYGQHAIDDLVNVAKVSTALVFLLS